MKNPHLLRRLARAQITQAARKYRPGDPVVARRYINVGTVGAPEIVAHPGDPGTVVRVREPGERDFGMMVVRFGGEEVDLTPAEIAPDWDTE
jgi:hypothetical protein